MSLVRLAPATPRSHVKHSALHEVLFIVLLSPDLYAFENNVDSDQLASFCSLSTLFSTLVEKVMVQIYGINFGVKYIKTISLATVKMGQNMSV